jgi:hypothetical protein
MSRGGAHQDVLFGEWEGKVKVAVGLRAGLRATATDVKRRRETALVTLTEAKQRDHQGP